MSTQYSVVPHPRLKREYEGRTIRTTRELRNGWGVIPAGVVATISKQSPKGSSLVFEPCNCCGLRAVISGVHKDDIEFVVPSPSSPDIAVLIRGLEEIIRNYENGDINHEQYRLHARNQAEHSLAAYRNGGEV